MMTNACREIDGDCANCKVCTALLDLRLLSHVTSHVAAKSILTLHQSAESELTRVGAAHEYWRCSMHIQLFIVVNQRPRYSCLVRGGHLALSTASPSRRKFAPTDSLSPISAKVRQALHSQLVYVAGMRPETLSGMRLGLASRMQSCSPVKAPPLPFAHFYGTSISRNPPWSSWARSSITPT